ncbi:hypothetical protein NESM_000178900 [Novymonas esmeraldas]|uniref:Uncharacterized protein n=1 Tax=Novymonas esmeraldas TaxID=1808958 RepID=A0AAW0F3Q0_9TRYP
MNTVAVVRSPCDLVRVCSAAPSGDASLTEASLLCVPASACSEVAGGVPTAADAAAAGGAGRRANAFSTTSPAWLSVTLACTLDVILQLHPVTSPDGLAALLRRCRGVRVRRSAPHFAHIRCANTHELCAPHGGLTAIPLSPADVVGTSVSTCSTGAATLSSRSTQQVSGNAAGHDGSGAASRCHTTTATKERTLAGVAQCLPTIAVLVRFPQRCRRALLLLRPSLVHRHERRTLAYVGSILPLSESVQHVALSPCGDAALLLGDAFVCSAPPRADAPKDRAATLLLHGGYVSLRSDELRPLLLHLELRGASARERVLHSLLRCRIAGAWCRLRLCDSVTTPCGVVLTDLAVYTSAGHALVFEPVASAAHVEAEAAAAVLYTCYIGAHLCSSARRRASAGAATVVAACTRGATGAGGALLVAPPWRFADQWRHSHWLANVLSAVAVAAATVSPTALCEDSWQRHHRGRHAAPAVLAMSTNRRVWLLSDGPSPPPQRRQRLSVATVPAGTAVGAGGDDARVLHTHVVELAPAHQLHDAQYVAGDGQAGFLLLCRCSIAGAATGDRVVHGAAPSSAVRLLFLPLVALRSSAASLHGRLAPSLLPIPVTPSAATLASLPESFADPTSRLRLVCVASATTMADTVYVTLGSSGAGRVAWTATVSLPSPWTACASWSPSPLPSLLPTQRGGVCVSGAEKEWVTHALSAVFPTGCLMDNSDGDAALAGPLEAALESALLRLGYPFQPVCASAAAAAAELGVDGGDAARAAAVSSAYPPATVAFLDAVHALLRACCAGGAPNSAGVTAVFAGCGAALRMSGLLGRQREADVVRVGGGGDGVGGGGVAATSRGLALLHGFAQLLRHAVEDVAATGDVSAVLACVSHLTQTVAAPATRGRPRMPPTAGEVWGLLLQPLFDFAWGVVHAYGAAAEVAAELLEYCSPATRAMADAGRLWWPDTRGRCRPGSSGPPDPAPASSGRFNGSSPPTAFVSPSATVAAPVPPSSLPLPAVAAAASYTSTELYEVVRRVLLMQGATAALRLVSELQQHKSTKVGAAEVAQMFEAMQRRLQEAVA